MQNDTSMLVGKVTGGIKIDARGEKAIVVGKNPHKIFMRIGYSDMSTLGYNVGTSKLLPSKSAHIFLPKMQITYHSERLQS